ncbi:DNA-binding protein [Bifidobacterium margollesii]|uniref:DNA-binding protein n=1 Tax=Bifidobacterium margollesii TaxID=2020964 RepID=A0A2N5J7L5_9BIFI|nr:DNA-binding protein [Bifidobacterium margollesii]
MPDRRRGASTTQIVVRILEVLSQHTDREHGMTLDALCSMVGASEKTLRGHLRMLEEIRPFGRTIGRLRRADIADALAPDATVGWYMEPVLDAAQVRLLADSLALSRINADTTRDLLGKLQTLSGLSGGTGEGNVAIDQIATPRHYNREFLINIEKLNDAIRAGRVVQYRYCRYDDTGELIPRTDETGREKLYQADPYQMLYKNGRYYLLCHRHGLSNLSYLHVDRIRELELLPESEPLQRRLDDFAPDSDGGADRDRDAAGSDRSAGGLGRGTCHFDIAAHMAERPYPMGGPAVDIRMRVTGSLEPIFDWFDRPEVTPVAPVAPAGSVASAGSDGSVSGRRVYDVRVHANERATLWWALQYSAFDQGVIEILAPQSLRDALRRTGETLSRRYAE